MACTCVVGLQWGDEAKGKIVDLLTDRHDLVVRYNGGANAGHTLGSGGPTYNTPCPPPAGPKPHLVSVLGTSVGAHPPPVLEQVPALRGTGIAGGVHAALSYPT